MTDKSIDELLNEGIAAYRCQDFLAALARLSETVAIEPRHWKARLYLAMSYYRSGQLLLASKEFRHIAENCPLENLRQNAEAALLPIKEEIVLKTVELNRAPSF